MNMSERILVGTKQEVEGREDEWMDVHDGGVDLFKVEGRCSRTNSRKEECEY
jgi:hypothetical protein